MKGASNIFRNFLTFFSVFRASLGEENPMYQNDKKECSTQLHNKNLIDATGNPYDPEDFSKLRLNVQELFGSRWAINYKGAIGVSHSVGITDAGLIHDNQLTLRVEFNLRQSWIAPDLEFPVGLFKDDDPPTTFVTADDKVLKHMWSPDSYIPTARESNMKTEGTPLSVVYIFKNRTIVFKVQMFTKVGCTSSFQWYPLDAQMCELVFESFKFQRGLYYYWTDDRMYRPVTVQMRRLLQYELLLPLQYDNGTVKRGGKAVPYPYVRLKFILVRKLGNNLIQVYTPTVLVVVLSWFSFWLGLDAVPGRITLLVTCMLTLVTMHAGVKKTIPPVHYITMMDVWLVCCMTMVFSAMFEFVAVRYFHWRYKQKMKSAEKLKYGDTSEQLHSFIRQVQEQLSSVKVINDQDPLVAPKNAWNTCDKPVCGKTENDLLRSVVSNKSRCIDHYAFRNNENEGHDREGIHGDCEVVMKPKGTGETKHRLKRIRNGKLKSVPIYVAMDWVCRGFFPVVFCIFNGIYWPVLLNNSNEIKDDEAFYHEHA